MRISDCSSDVCSADLIGKATSSSALAVPRSARSLNGPRASPCCCIFRAWRDIGRERPSRTGHPWPVMVPKPCARRSEEHTSELQSLMRISYAVFCLKKKTVPHQPLYITYKNQHIH